MAVLALVVFGAVAFVVVVGLAVSGNWTLRRILLFSVVVVLALVTWALFLPNPNTKPNPEGVWRTCPELRDRISAASDPRDRDLLEINYQRYCSTEL